MGIPQIRAGSDHYRTLGIDPSAGPEEIRGAYLSLARKLHPDVSGNPETAQAMSRTNVAYQALQTESPFAAQLPTGLMPVSRIPAEEIMAPYRRAMGFEDRWGRLLDVKA